METIQADSAKMERASGRLEFVDALRGGACLWVVLLHFQNAFLGVRVLNDSLLAALFTRIACLGYLGVNLFLMLSGFCLFYPLARRQEERIWRVEPGPFFLRRARRILPPYYAALTLAVAIALTVGRASREGRWPLPADVAAHVLMLHNLFAATADSLNYVFWSLALEAQLYVVFPLLLWLARRGGLKMVLTVTLAISLVWQAFMTQWVGVRVAGGTGYVAYNALPGRAFEFACGMAAAWLVARPRSGQTAWAGAGLCVSLPLGIWLSMPGAGDVPAFTVFSPWQNYVWAMAFFCAVVFAAHATRERGWLDVFVAPTARVGVFSYSIYLIHVPALGVLSRVMAGREMGIPARIGLFFGAVLPLILIAGLIFFLLFEKPFLHTPKSRHASSL